MKLINASKTKNSKHHNKYPWIQDQMTIDNSNTLPNSPLSNLTGITRESKSRKKKSNFFFVYFCQYKKDN